VMGRDIIIKGDGTPERSYLYAADLAVWLLRALVLGQSGRAYHIGSDQALSLSDLARRIGQINTPPTQVEIRGAAQAGGFRSRYVPSIRRAKAELGCEIWTPLDEAIKRTAQWARDNGLPSLKQKDHADG
jgi:nucleoside-diphosphate-sugar epimerase